MSFHRGAVSAGVETAVCRTCGLPIWRPAGDDAWFSEGSSTTCCPDIGGQVASYHQPERGVQG